MCENINCLCEACNNSLVNRDLFNMLFTIISGVLVYIAGQLFNEYFLKPIQQYKQLRAKISFSLTYYAELYMNPIHKSNDEEKRWENGSQKIRELASEVRATIELKPFGNVFIAKKSTLDQVAKNLIGISNSFFSTKNGDQANVNYRYRNEIYKLLKIRNSIK